MTGELERITRLETKVEIMERVQEKLDARLEEIQSAQITFYNEMNLHFSDLSNRFAVSERRWDWLSKLILGVLTATVVGVIMLWIKGSV